MDISDLSAAAAAEAERAARGFDDAAAWLAANWVDLALALAAAALIVALLSFLRGFLARIVRGGPEREEPATMRGLMARLIAKTSTLLIVLVAIAAGAQIFVLPESWSGVLGFALIAALILQAAIWASALVRFAIANYAVRASEDNETLANAMGLIRFFGNVAVWSVALLLILDNAGVDVTALIAGLGIGGIAIGLAAQGIFSDLFGSLSIVLDKPFVKGDFIVFGEMSGTVEKIGLKSTRIRALSGEQIVVANADLLSTRIRNFKRMWERRATFTVGVTYETPPEKLRRARDLIEEVIRAQDGVRFDRAHFLTMSAASLDFEAVYFVLAPDYAAFADIQQAINLALIERFAAEGIDFTYPTQTPFLKGGGETD